MTEECLVRSLKDSLRTVVQKFTPSLSSCPQVVTPVRTGQGYVYEYPSRHQKDIYDIPPSHTTQGVRTRTVVTGGGEHFRVASLRASEQRDVHKLCMFHMMLYLGYHPEAIFTKAV